MKNILTCVFISALAAHGGSGFAQTTPTKPSNTIHITNAQPGSTATLTFETYDMGNTFPIRYIVIGQNGNADFYTEEFIAGERVKIEIFNHSNNPLINHYTINDFVPPNPPKNISYSFTTKELTANLSGDHNMTGIEIQCRKRGLANFQATVPPGLDNEPYLSANEVEVKASLTDYIAGDVLVCATLNNRIPQAPALNNLATRSRNSATVRFQEPVLLNQPTLTRNGAITEITGTASPGVSIQLLDGNGAVVSGPVTSNPVTGAFTLNYSAPGTPAPMTLQAINIPSATALAATAPEYPRTQASRTLFSAAGPTPGSAVHPVPTLNTLGIFALSIILFAFARCRKFIAK